MLEKYLYFEIAKSQQKEILKEEDTEFTDSQKKELEVIEEKIEEGNVLLKTSIQNMGLEELRLIMYKIDDLLSFFEKKEEMELRFEFYSSRTMDSFSNQKSRAVRNFSFDALKDKLVVVKRGLEIRNKKQNNPEARLLSEVHSSGDVQNILDRISNIKEIGNIGPKYNIVKEMEKNFLRDIKESYLNYSNISEIIKKYSDLLDDFDHFIGESFANSIEGIIDVGKELEEGRTSFLDS